MLREIGDLELAREVAGRRERHKLILHLERALSSMYRPAGGLSCPELELHIRESLERNPRELKIILRSLIQSYRRRMGRAREAYS